MAITIPITTTFDSKGIDKFSRDIQKAEGGWKKAAVGVKAAALPAAAALAGIGVAAYKATKDASALGETFNAVDKVFGESASTITAFGETAATQAGLSQRAFQQMATNTGSVLTNMGYSTDEAANSTVDLAKRAADMASVFDTDVETALEAINSGLRGQSEPLRQFGVSLSAAEVEATAMAMGLADGEGQIDKHAKALATEALILEQTAKAAGDFADTSGSAANALRVQGAQVENLSASFGQALLPAMEKVIAIGISLTSWVAENQTLFQVMAASVAVFAAAILVVNAALAVYETITKVVTLANKLLGKSWFTALGPILLVIAAVAAVIAIGYLVWKNWDKISAGLRVVWEAIKKAAAAVFGAIKTIIVTYFKAYKAVVVAVWNAIKTVITAVLKGIKTAVSTYVNAYKTIFTTVFNAIKTVVTNVINKIKSTITSVMGKIKSAINTAMSLIKAIFRGDFGEAKAIIETISDQIVSLMGALPGKIVSALGSLGSLLYNKGRDLVQGFINGIRSLLGTLGGVAGNILSAINPFSASTAAAPSARSFAAPGARAATTNSTTTNLTMNINARDPYVAARVMQRASEGYSMTQGRGRGTPLAVAW